MPADLLLAIDQGTTSTRAMAFDTDLRPVAVAQEELTQHFPRDGWVEHDPEEIWRATLATVRAVCDRVGVGRIAAIGIANQRETTVVWDRATGAPIHRAIVWQDRRGAETCRRLMRAGHEPLVTRRTGLVLDSYFSATKLQWLLDTVPGARERAARGELAFGTIDSFLLWRLTGGAVHATDVTNAARTMLFDIHAQRWDPELLALFDVPAAMLPAVRDNAADFGTTPAALFGRPLPVAGMAGDQQAAAVGQACFDAGTVKSTYGTGCFLLANTGATPVASTHRLLTTIARRIGGETAYALEGSIFNAGTAVKWLRDSLGVIASAEETQRLAETAPERRGVYFVPAFTGLGAPHWDPDARGAILGLGRDTGIGEIVRAGLEAVCFQTRDVVDAMAADGVPAPKVIRVDGGMAANDWMLQFLADMLGTAVERPVVGETTALGAACLAGLRVGLFGSLADIAGRRARDRTFTPAMPADERRRLADGWDRAVRRVRGG